jgi:protein-S-isoprenylcysteine O-methyltransferase Ste14
VPDSGGSGFSGFPALGFRLQSVAMLKAVSVFGYLAMAGGLLALLLTHRVLSPSPFVIAVQIGSVALMLWARVTFGRRSFHAAANPTEGGLVTTGPYHYIRHPIYTAVCLFVTAGVAAHLSLLALLLYALVLGGTLVRIYCEEHLVLARYPEYRLYAAKTPRMIPFVF